MFLTSIHFEVCTPCQAQTLPGNLCIVSIHHFVGLSRQCTSHSVAADMLSSVKMSHIFVFGNAVIPVAFSSTVIYIALSQIIITTHTTQHHVRHKRRVLTEQISYSDFACPILPNEEKA